MMKNYKSPYVTILSLTIFAYIGLNATSAWAFRFSLYGMINDTIERDNAEPHASQSAILGPGGGISLGIPLASFVDLDLGLSYQKSGYSLSVSSLNNYGINITVKSTYKWSTMEVPIGLRFWIFDFLSLGFGAYYQRFVSDVSIDTTTTTNGSTTTTGKTYKWADVNGYNYNFGLYGCGGINIPIFSEMAIFVDGKYNFGLFNITRDSSRGWVVKLNDFQTLIGLRFSI